MAEFRLERFKYNWRGAWVAGVSYKRDDIVRVNGKSYVCIITHVSSGIFRTDLLATLPGSNPPQPQPKWTVMTSGRSFEGDWTNGTTYNIGDIVIYDGSLWTCVTPHTASNFASDFTNWTVFAQSIKYLGNWTNGITYAPGAIVSYNGNSYKCIAPHTSSGNLENNEDDWVLYHVGIEVRNNWTGNTEYRVNDLVKYGGTVFRCIETHVSNSTNLDDTKFQIELFGSQYDGEWDSTTYYNIGDIVRHRGFMYYAINNNRNSKPFIDNDQGSQDWLLLARSYSFIGSWSIDAEYKTGDIVLRGGNLYTALRDIGGDEVIDGSTADYLDSNTWELIIPGKSFKGNWTAGTVYSVGDVIYFKGSAYSCNVEHQAAVINAPEDNGSGYFYWDTLIQSGQPAALRQKGDLLTYGLSREIDDDGSTIFDGSTIGDVRLAIGEGNQLLSISNELEAYWRNITEDSDAVYVATNGIDDDNRGSFQNPFRTIRFAAEYVEDNYDPLTPVIIRVSTGKFEEIGPIIVPAGCAINGDELRSTTVVANPPLPEYQDDYQYVEDYLDYFISILFNLVTGVRITPQTGNNEIQNILETVPVLDVFGNPVLDVFGNPVETSNGFPASNLEGTNAVAGLIEVFKNYIEFRISNGIVNPTLTASNTLNENQLIVNAGLALSLNKRFIASEIYHYLKNTYTNITFDENKIKSDIYSFIRGIKRDLTYSGNYGIITSARRYSNAVTGSQLENLFLMRDTTGLRDLTTAGLQGTLNPPGVFDLYQKPTGGALVSLDPGWGADDDRTWIINRSPYIQGVTNTGTGCVGMKVDGALHNGGNKSMTANDFTQVLSDGIGAWITNNARAELVSVFTYYCQIGYFAEDGGIIRATNGNNSYGRYGAISDGADDTETPQSASVFNRNNQAQVVEAFAGGSSDQILIFEYTNTGEEYSQASATITGAGAFAEVEYDDFRSDSIFEARLTSPDGSTRKGGSGYLVRQGNAQETLGASSTIKLSQTDVTQFLSEIEGMRIIITDGTGVGQYGYVQDFNFVNKTVTVYRESDDQAGWDHIIPGTPIVADLDLTTRYRIEPRITVSSPGFSAQEYNLFTNRTYTDVTYGNTTQVFNNITGSGVYLWEDAVGSSVTVREIISPISMQFNGQITTPPTLPFTIEGKTSGATTIVTAITANTGTVLEATVNSSVGFLEGERMDIIVSSGTGETFDDDPIPAVFNITRAGRTYSATLVNGGAGYRDNDTIIISGTSLGGTSPENDAFITITSVSSDSTNSIQTFTISGTGREGKFVSLTNSEYSRYSNNGSDWTEVSLPFVGAYNTLIAGNNRFIAVASGESRVASSLTGESWTTVNLPLSANWTSGTYGNGKFIIVGSDTDIVLSSTNGVTWSSGSIPDDTDGGVDSTTSTWVDVTYGKGKYVAISSSDGASATSSDGTTWTRHDSAISFNPEHVVYGNNRYVAMASSDGEIAYSFDGITWYDVTNTLSDLAGENYQVADIKYANGIFFALGGPLGAASQTAFTSEDGIIWTQRNLTISQQWTALTYGNIGNDVYRWILLASAASTGGVNHIRTGAQAKLRSDVVTGSFRNIKIWDPGSGYSAPPVITVTDPNPAIEVTYESRIGNGVLSQPSFINRGAGYRRNSSVITVTGDGYADIIPEGQTITLSGVEEIPGPGVQIRITGIEDPNSIVPGELAIFSGVEVIDLGDDGTRNGTRLVQFTVTPSLETEFNIAHNTSVTLRERYSQCRITGHDFLDIGTGNFEQTNYPDIYAQGRFFTAAPENEVYETNSGRVFYTSTDQDGNFRTGELFAVNQATGIVTISAQFFDLDGLSELSLGGVRLGGSGTVVNEFSTDATFAADSNNVIPTQRAIATFLANRLSVGGESLEVNRLQAGRVIVGGDTNELNNVVGGYLNIPSDVSLQGTFETTDENGDPVIADVGISGTIVSQILFLRRFDDTMQ